MTKNEALKLAIEAFQDVNMRAGMSDNLCSVVSEALEACKSTLEDETSSSDTAEMQEPFGYVTYSTIQWYGKANGISTFRYVADYEYKYPLYLHPVKNEASSLREPIKRLTDDEIDKVFQKIMIQFGSDYKKDIANAIMERMIEVNSK